MSWRTGCIAFALLSVVLGWRSWTRTTVTPTAAACAELDDDRDRDRAADTSDPWSRDRGGAPTGRKPTAGGDDDGDDGEGPGLSAPAWMLWLAPQPGEDLLHYRDRIVPLAQAAIAPQRARVARGKEAFAAAAGLDAHQRAELDAAVAEAADTIQTHVLDAVLGGDLMPAHFKAMAAVGLGRDVLDTVDRANRRFLSSLTDDQRALLAHHPFDLADYLLFSTRWEDALGYGN